MVTFTADGTARASFVTLVMPRTHAGEPVPELAVRFARGVATADVRCGAAGNVYDRITWTLDGNVAPLEADAIDAVATWSREVRR